MQFTVTEFAWVFVELSQGLQVSLLGVWGLGVLGFRVSGLGFLGYIGFRPNHCSLRPP